MNPRQIPAQLGRICALSVCFLVGLGACEYNGDSLIDVTSVGGPPEERLAPSFPLNLPPDQRLRTASERDVLERDLQSTAEVNAASSNLRGPRVAGSQLSRDGDRHFDQAITEIESQSNAPYTPPDCANVDDDPNTVC